MQKCDIVTVAHHEGAEKILYDYPMQEQKLSICRFGLVPIDTMKNLQHVSIPESRQILNMPQNKIIITIGYNYSPNQQLDKIIPLLSNSEFLTEIRDQLYFVFPFTYGDSKKYRTLILELLKTFPFDYQIISEYLNELENAHLRRISDIFIQAQRSDQFSGTMLEYLYGNALVITGTWLPYQLLKDSDVYYKEISSLDALPAVLIDSIEGM